MKNEIKKNTYCSTCGQLITNEYWKRFLFVKRFIDNSCIENEPLNTCNLEYLWRELRKTEIVNNISSKEFEHYLNGMHALNPRGQYNFSALVRSIDKSKQFNVNGSLVTQIKYTLN